MQKGQVGRYCLVGGCTVLTSEVGALLLSGTKDLVASLSWSILFAAGLAWLMGGIERGTHRWARIFRGISFVLAGGIAGTAFAFAVAIVLGPWVGGFSMPLGMCWLAGGISGGIAQEASCWMRRRWGSAVAVTIAIGLAIVAVAAAGVVSRVAEEPNVVVIWFKWEPGEQGLRVDQQLLNKRERLTVDEIERLKKTGVRGKLICCATGGHGGSEEKGRPIARLILIISRQVEKPVALRLPDHATIFYIQREEGWSAVPDDAPLRAEAIRVEAWDQKGTGETYRGRGNRGIDW